MTLINRVLCFYIFNHNNLAVLTHLTLLILGLFGSFEI